MKSIRPLALAAALLLLAGCAGGGASSIASSSNEAGGTAAEPYVPTYTYVNPDPSMVLIASPGGDITYENYRLYLDVTEAISRYSARQNLGLTAAIERDLVQLGISINEEEFSQTAAQQTMMAYYNNPVIFSNLKLVGEVSGLSEEKMMAAITASYRPQYLINLLGMHFQQEVEKDLPPIVLPPTIDSGSEDGKAEILAAQEREQEIYEAASERLSEYSKGYDTRLQLEDPALLATFDGEKIPFTDSGREYIEYCAVSSRVEAISFLQEGEMMLRSLEARGKTLDRAEFEKTLTDYRAAIVGEDAFYQELTRICADFGATPDDYLRQLERPLWLQYSADLYYNTLTEEYNALAEDDPARPATFDEYFVQTMDKALEGSEVRNLAG